ncbi:hypothetical protein [Anaerotignum lactatifermentans]|uniref:hypothetical protein n=1 Tax=Anaerotignum lactatifermentans TaxID=160404 RepID=UPI003AB6D0B5
MPKLPADLPENWTQGQTISPNGTETGLTEQHGYNYLMKQVNNTQTEVNNINGALPDVAQQATVNEIKNKIGTEADADTQPTLFGRLAQLKKVLLEKLAEMLTKVTGIDGKIGTSGDTESTDTLFGSLKKVLNSVDEKYYNPSDAVKATLTTDGVGSNGTGTQVVLKRKAEYSGTIRIKIASAYSSESKPIRILIFSGSNISSGGGISVSDVQPLLDAMKSSEGTKVSGIISSAIYCNFNTQIVGSASNLCFDLNVNKGEYYYMLCSWSAAYVGNYVKNAQLCYDII